MKLLSTCLLIFLFAISVAQEPQWFELGTTWTYNWNGVVDPDQEDFIYSYTVTEITEYLGQSCSKIEAVAGSFGCILVEPPYYMYHSNDTVFYATAGMAEFAIGYVLSENAEWLYTVSMDELTEVLSATVMDVSEVSIDGQQLSTYDVEYNHHSGFMILAEISPPLRKVWEFIGDLNMVIVPFGVSPVCDIESSVKLRCFSSPSFSYQNPDFESCTLGLTEADREATRVFPNPAEGIIYWDNPVDQIALFDATGKLLLQKQINGEQSMSVENLPPGFYTVLFTEKNSSFSQKLIIK